MFSSSIIRLWSCCAVSCTGGGGPAGVFGGSSPRAGATLANARTANPGNHRKDAADIGILLGWCVAARHSRPRLLGLLSDSQPFAFDITVPPLSGGPAPAGAGVGRGQPDTPRTRPRLKASTQSLK